MINRFFLAITPKTGRVRRYVRRQAPQRGVMPAGKAEIQLLSGEDAVELEHFRRVGWPDEPFGGSAA